MKNQKLITIFILTLTLCLLLTACTGAQGGGQSENTSGSAITTGSGVSSGSALSSDSGISQSTNGKSFVVYDKTAGRCVASLITEENPDYSVIELWAYGAIIDQYKRWDNYKIYEVEQGYVSQEGSGPLVYAVELIALDEMSDEEKANMPKYIFVTGYRLARSFGDSLTYIGSYSEKDYPEEDGKRDYLGMAKAAEKEYKKLHPEGEYSDTKLSEFMALNQKTDFSVSTHTLNFYTHNDLSERGRAFYEIFRNFSENDYAQLKTQGLWWDDYPERENEGIELYLYHAGEGEAKDLIYAIHFYPIKNEEKVLFYYYSLYNMDLTIHGVSENKDLYDALVELIEYAKTIELVVEYKYDESETEGLTMLDCMDEQQAWFDFALDIQSKILGGNWNFPSNSFASSDIPDSWYWKIDTPGIETLDDIVALGNQIHTEEMSRKMLAARTWTDEYNPDPMYKEKEDGVYWYEGIGKPSHIDLQSITPVKYAYVDDTHMVMRIEIALGEWLGEDLDGDGEEDVAIYKEEEYLYHLIKEDDTWKFDDLWLPYVYWAYNYL